MWIVTLQLEVLELEVEEILNVGVDNHTWQGTWLAGKLQLGLLYMVQVQVSVASGVDKVALGGGPELGVADDKPDESKFPTVIEGKVEEGRLRLVVHDVFNGRIVLGRFINA